MTLLCRSCVVISRGLFLVSTTDLGRLVKRLPRGAHRQPPRKCLGVKPDQFVTFLTCILVVVLPVSENVCTGPRLLCGLLTHSFPNMQSWFLCLLTFPSLQHVCFPATPCCGKGAEQACLAKTCSPYVGAWFQERE